MDLDPRLQNISAADLQDFAVPHYPNFDQGYQSALYETALNDEHAAPAHPQSYAQYVTDPSEQSHFIQSNASSAQAGVDTTSVNRSLNAAIHSANNNAAPLNSRQSRHIQQQQHTTPSHYNSHAFTSPKTALSRNRQGQNNPTNTPPSLVQRPTSRSQVQQQLQTQSQASNSLTQTPQQRHPQKQQQQPRSQAKNPPAPTSTSVNINPDHDIQPPADPSQFTHPSTFPLIPNPPNLTEWREKFFNIEEPLLLTSEEYHTYFPHVDNVYSHRSTQKYKKKPFVSHYWDCRLKGRPTGTPLAKLRKRQEGGGRADVDDDGGGSNGGTSAGAGADNDGNNDEGDSKEVKKRKRKTRERDLCDVKIKVTEFFGRDELEALGRANGEGGDDDTGNTSNPPLTFVLEDGTSANPPPPAAAGHNKRSSIGQAAGGDDSMTFGILEPMKNLPEGHPGAEGKRWYMVQRVNGSGKEGDTANLDHKHTMEESDRIKKNSVQRWLLTQEKERKKHTRGKSTTDVNETAPSRSVSQTLTPSFHASGKAHQTAKSHSIPVSTQLTFFANSFCPFAQRIWIALELKGIPYQYHEVTPSQMKDGKCIVPGLIEVCPEGIIPALRHGNWAIWESDVILEYLEDLSMGHSLLPLDDPQLRAHSRLWKDHINRKILPYFYALLLLPTIQRDQREQVNGELPKLTLVEKQSILITTLQKAITDLVNASHATGPFFLGSEISFVDVAFAPWIIRLSRVLEHFRYFPKPEVGTRWKAWVDAVESHDAVRRTVSDDKSYHAVYGTVGRETYAPDLSVPPPDGISELWYAQCLVRQQGFGLHGDFWGTLLMKENPVGMQR